MNAIRNVGSYLMSNDMQEHVLKVAGVTALASICAYGGTFFFTSHRPLSGAVYLGSVALISHIAYLVFEQIKDAVDHPKLKYALTTVQLFQIPIVFYFSPGSLIFPLSGSVQLEIIVASAHFVAIPLFFHLGIKAWYDPSFANIAAVAGVMLSLANGLRNYIRI